MATKKAAKPVVDTRWPSERFEAEVVDPITIRILRLGEVRIAAESDWRTENCCPKCRGFGGYENHWTLDYMHGTWVSCDQCDGEVVGCPIGPSREEEELRKLANALGAVLKTLQRMERDPRGFQVIAVKGRKVPVGTVGKCTKIFDGDWGRRICIVATDGQEHWTSLDNVRVVDAIKIARELSFADHNLPDLSPERVAQLRTWFFWGQS